MNSQEIYNESLLNRQEIYFDFISGFKRSAGFETTKYADQVWAEWSRQLSDSARAAVENQGYEGGVLAGKAFARLIPPPTPEYKWMIISRPGMPPWGYAATMRDARRLQKSARRQGLDGSIERNK